MNQLEEILISNQDARQRIITTDGVFSMDGYVARLDEICDLANKYDLSPYIKQSLELTKRYIDSVFGKEIEKQEVLVKWF